MRQVSSELSPDHLRFVQSQCWFFVATAPLNLSEPVRVFPKCRSVLRIVSPKRVVYLEWAGDAENASGDGDETAVHINENARLTMLFCYANGDQKHLHLHGTGRVYLPRSQEWKALEASHPMPPDVVRIVNLDIDCVQTFCGFDTLDADVPRMMSSGPREKLPFYRPS